MDLSPYLNRAEHAGTDIAIFDWEGQQVWGDTRRDIDAYARQLLGAFGFVRADAPEAASSYRLRPTLPRPVLRAHATTAAQVLSAAGYNVTVDPALSTGMDLRSAVAAYRATAANRQAPARKAAIPPPTAATAAARRTR
jgi:hypothetical protein